MGGKKKKRGYRSRGPDQFRVRAPHQVRVLPLFEDLGGLRPGTARLIHEATGVPEAEAYGVGSFYHLVAKPDVEAWVCDGVSCAMQGAEALLADLLAEGVKAQRCSCLGQCDRAPAALWIQDHAAAVTTGRAGALAPPGLTPSGPDLAIDLAGTEDTAWTALALDTPADEVVAQLKASGLRGRGGAGFPAHIKWAAVAAEPPGTKYVVCNADEGEPGTFKDREVMVLRPHLMLEGMAIGARAVGAEHLIIYLRGEFPGPRRALEAAIDAAEAAGHLAGLQVELVLGHGAYICGEETALLEALEGRRGMPRHKPPFPTQAGLHGRPTLMSNVETFACVPGILHRGGAWFAALGRGEGCGSKLYSISGDVARPGVYELAQGATMAELLDAAGGVLGELLAFSPGGASSGFLPANRVDVALDFEPLQSHGSMLGSAGVVVLNTTRDLFAAVLAQAEFFKRESCGQCAPCRIGTQVQVRLLESVRAGEPVDPGSFERLAWEMDAGSICGLGQIAALPVTHLIQHFPEALPALFRARLQKESP